MLIAFRGNTQISYCVSCKAISIWHNNLMFNFTELQFSSFKRYTAGLDFDDCVFTFPDGEDRVMLDTPSKEISLAFTKEEWDNFSEAMEEAGVMRECYCILDQHR